MRELNEELNDLKDKTRSKQVNIVASCILEQNDCINSLKTMTGSEVCKKYKALYRKDDGFVDIPENTFCTKLSVLSQQPSSVSCIKSAEGKNGYYVDLNLNGEETVSQSVDVKIKESALYESIELWLGTKVSVATNIANKRMGKKWQNVDIIGLSIYDYLGSPCLEVYSVEVKLSKDNWRQDLFEAVSHSVVANYSYFAFMIKASDVNKIDDNLKIYAHKFNIGLLAIAIDDNKWEAVNGGTKISIEGKKANAKIIEISIAPEHEVSRKFQNEFLENVLDIQNINDVYKLSRNNNH